MQQTLYKRIVQLAQLQVKLEGHKSDKKECDKGIEIIIAATRIGKDRAAAIANIEAVDEAIALLKEGIEVEAIEAFMALDTDKQMEAAGGAVIVRSQANVCVLDPEAALNYVHAKAPAMVKLVPVNKRSYESHLRKVAETLDPKGVHEMVQVIYEPKVLYFKKKLAALLVTPEPDQGEDNRIEF